MEKKIYQQPTMNVVTIETTGMLANSPLTEVSIGDNYDGTMPIEAPRMTLIDGDY